MKHQSFCKQNVFFTCCFQNKSVTRHVCYFWFQFVKKEKYLYFRLPCEQELQVQMKMALLCCFMCCILSRYCCASCRSVQKPFFENQTLQIHLLKGNGTIDILFSTKLINNRGTSKVTTSESFRAVRWIKQSENMTQSVEQAERTSWWQSAWWKIVKCVSRNQSLLNYSFFFPFRQKCLQFTFVLSSASRCFLLRFWKKLNKKCERAWFNLAKGR